MEVQETTQSAEGWYAIHREDILPGVRGKALSDRSPQYDGRAQITPAHSQDTKPELPIEGYRHTRQSRCAANVQRLCLWEGRLAYPLCRFMDTFLNALEEPFLLRRPLGGNALGQHRDLGSGINGIRRMLFIAEPAGKNCRHSYFSLTHGSYPGSVGCPR